MILNYFLINIMIFYFNVKNIPYLTYGMYNPAQKNDDKQKIIYGPKKYL